MRSLISPSEYTDEADLSNQSSRVLGVLGHYGGWYIIIYTPSTVVAKNSYDVVRLV